MIDHLKLIFVILTSIIHLTQFLAAQDSDGTAANGRVINVPFGEEVDAEDCKTFTSDIVDYNLLNVNNIGMVNQDVCTFHELDAAYYTDKQCLLTIIEFRSLRNLIVLCNNIEAEKEQMETVLAKAVLPVPISAITMSPNVIEAFKKHAADYQKQKKSKGSSGSKGSKQKKKGSEVTKPGANILLICSLTLFINYLY